MTDRLAESPTPFAKALGAAVAPLRFACGGEGERLGRVRDLEATVREALGRAAALAADVPGRERLLAVGKRLPSPIAAPAVRLAALRPLLAELEAELTRAGQPGSPQPPGSQAAVAASPVEVESTVEEPAPKPAAPRKSAATRTTSAPTSVSAVGGAAAPARLAEGLQFLKGVGPKVALLLAGRDLRTIEDLLRFLPRRYEDRRGRSEIASLRDGEVASVEGEIIATGGGFARRRGYDVTLADGTGKLTLKWFHAPGGLRQRLVRGRRLRVSGQVKRFGAGLQMVHPETRLLDTADGEPGLEPPNAAPGAGEAQGPEDAIVPLYAEVEGLRPAQLRRIIHAALPTAAALEEWIPAGLVKRRGLLSPGEAVQGLHAPPPSTTVEDLQAAKTPWHARLIYEELFFLQLAVLRRRAQTVLEAGKAVPLRRPLAEVASSMLPFAITRAQARVLGDIEKDLSSHVPMHRLLQGDVGSGKTAVALSAAAAVAEAGLQTAILAPTEILAEQHARTALKLLHPRGIRMGLLTGSLSASERRRTLYDLQHGVIAVLVGTHAVIQDDVRFKSLALGIVDEQHRFGVLQRGRLIAQGRASFGAAPHMLAMTATPIPRSLALTVYGDLELSVIDELPPGRTPIRTKLYKEKERDAAYARVRKAVEAGRQAFVVFPLVEESDKEGVDHLKDATSALEELSAGALHGLRLALLHGRMSGDEKDRVMRAFGRGDIDVLVATTVVEVGIDVPNATMMVIENAERFGLSQLHQLRGRVGRGAHESHCLLIARYTRSEDAWRRLLVMEQSTDGFHIAEEDLAMRGPGDFLGTRQSGLPLLSVANLVRDQQVLVQAREDAKEILAADPSLELPEHRALRRRLESVWHEKLELAQIG